MFVAATLAALVLVAESFALPPHPSVLEVVAEEAALPAYLKSPALRNPETRRLLALSSVLHHGEQPVFEHISKEIPRHKIHSMLIYAGFIPRGLKFFHPQLNQDFSLDNLPRYDFSSNFENIFSHPEFLQHL